MRKLILNILKEENEILERMMGLKLGKVKSALPSQYLVKTTKKQEKLSTEKRRLKLISSRVNALYSQIEKELKTLNWSDLELTPRDDFFFVVLPKKIKTKRHFLLRSISPTTLSKTNNKQKIIGI